MNTENENAILGVLRRHPEGTTAKVAAGELHWKETAASLRMGRLACAGVIDRTSPPGRLNNLFLYHVKQAPPTAPALERWKPTTKNIAERAYV